MTAPAPPDPAGPAPAPGGATEVFLHERASATPRATPPRPPRPRAAAPERGLAPAPRTLREVQLWFASATVDGDLDALTEADALRVLTAGPRMSAVERLGVYHHGYRARLVECLLDDYPAVQHALGADAFEDLARAYVVAHPSRSPNLNAYGRHMADFAEARGDAFVADLARLEWALVEVLHAREAEKLSPEALAGIPTERWAEARLPASATARLLRFRYPVNEYFQAFRAGDPPDAIPAPSPSATAVYRVGLMLWRMDLTPPMAALLEHLFAGDPLGEALGAIETAAGTPEALAEAERNVMVWFREWVAGGLFARVDLDRA